jgi:predicted DsbA family dithiol-disulfide isomerase
MASITVDIISDVVCPWCFIGLHRLQVAMRLFDVPVDFTLRFHPYLLDASVPESGERIADRIRARYQGADPEPMFDRVNEAARESGLDLDVRRQPTTYPTLKAHTLLRLAAVHDVQLAVAHALFRTHFMEAGNVSDNAALVRIAADCGMDAELAASAIASERALAQTKAEAAHLADSGVRGVPFFLFGGKLAVSGAQPVPALMQAMRQFA